MVSVLECPHFVMLALEDSMFAVVDLVCSLLVAAGLANSPLALADLETVLLMAVGLENSILVFVDLEDSSLVTVALEDYQIGMIDLEGSMFVLLDVEEPMFVVFDLEISRRAEILHKHFPGLVGPKHFQFEMTAFVDFLTSLAARVVPIVTAVLGELLLLHCWPVDSVATEAVGLTSTESEAVVQAAAVAVSAGWLTIGPDPEKPTAEQFVLGCWSAARLVREEVLSQSLASDSVLRWELVGMTDIDC